MSTEQIYAPPAPVTRERPRLAPKQWPVRKTTSLLALYILVALFVVITLGPIYWIVLSAFTPISELFTTPLHYIPQHPSLINFQTVALVVPLFQLFMNSTVLSVLSASFSVVVCLLAAYGFARIPFPGRNVLFLGLLLSSYLPTIAMFIPLFQMFQRLSRLHSLQGLVILLVSFLLPTSVWIMTSC